MAKKHIDSDKLTALHQEAVALLQRFPKQLSKIQLITKKELVGLLGDVGMLQEGQETGKVHPQGYDDVQSMLEAIREDMRAFKLLE